MQASYGPAKHEYKIAVISERFGEQGAVCLHKARKNDKILWIYRQKFSDRRKGYV